VDLIGIGTAFHMLPDQMLHLERGRRISWLCFEQDSTALELLELWMDHEGAAPVTELATGQC
jgi:hypothetical protein